MPKKGKGKRKNEELSTWKSVEVSGPRAAAKAAAVAMEEESEDAVVSNVTPSDYGKSVYKPSAAPFGALTSIPTQRSAAPQLGAGGIIDSDDSDEDSEEKARRKEVRKRRRRSRRAVAEDESAAAAAPALQAPAAAPAMQAPAAAPAAASAAPVAAAQVAEAPAAPAASTEAAAAAPKVKTRAKTSAAHYLFDDNNTCLVRGCNKKKLIGNNGSSGPRLEHFKGDLAHQHFLKKFNDAQGDEARATVLQEIMNVPKEVVDTLNRTNTTQDDENETPSPAKKKVWEAMAEVLVEELVENAPKVRRARYGDALMASVDLAKPYDVLKEWHTSKDDTRRSAYAFAASWLCIPATEASVERVFSTAKYVFNPLRSRLLNANLEALLIVRAWILRIFRDENWSDDVIASAKQTARASASANAAVAQQQRARIQLVQCARDAGARARMQFGTWMARLLSYDAKKYPVQVASIRAMLVTKTATDYLVD